MTVAGIGCRRGATAEEVLAAIAAARARHGLARLDALAALDRKRGETGIAEAAARLGLPLLIAEPAGDAPGMLTRSAASLAATGTGSASEALNSLWRMPVPFRWWSKGCWRISRHRSRKA